MIGESASVFFIINDDTVGLYKCEVSVNGFPTISRTAEVTMNSAPVTKLEKSSYVAIVGFYISLKYEASATKNCFNTIVERWEKSRGRK